MGQAQCLERQIADLLCHVERHLQFCRGLSRIAMPNHIEAELRLM